MTTKDKTLVTTKREQCRKCIYRGHNFLFGGLYCNYLSIVGHSRQCPARACEHFVAGKQIRMSKNAKEDDFL